MRFSSQKIIDLFAKYIIYHSPESANFSLICALDDIQENGLVFITDSADCPKNIHLASIVICQDNQLNAIQAQFSGYVISVKNVRLAQALIKQHFQSYQAKDTEWGEIHPSALIHPSAKIGKDCHIGPYAVIGANCKIGSHVIIRSHCVIEHDAIIGDNTIINSLSNIGYACRLGKNVMIQSGVIIGNEGFGFAPDEKGNFQHIPHTGYVQIDDSVFLGSQCCVDRGTYGITHIERGVKIDNQCHVGHNVRIGENTLIIAQTGIAGSSDVGKRVILSGQTGVLDHRKIADDAILLHRAGVTVDVPHAGKWAGTPVMPIKEYVKEVNLPKKVARLEKKLREVNSALTALKKTSSD